MALGLLVVIGALVLPSLQVPFQNQRLRKAGEVVRVEWNKARIKAMKTGQIQMFRYTVEEGTFSVEPYYTEQDMLEADAQHSRTGVAGVNAAMLSADRQEEMAESPSGNLPEGIVFATSEVESDVRGMQIQQQIQGTQAGVTRELSPILFYPDGTTSDARVALTNEYRKLYVVVSLRSLTGIAKVSELVTSEQVQQVP